MESWQPWQQITYRRGAGIRVQAVVIANQQWGLSAAEIAEEYGLSQKQVDEALAFYDAHHQEIEFHLATEIEHSKPRTA